LRTLIPEESAIAKVTNPPSFSVNFTGMGGCGAASFGEPATAGSTSGSIGLSPSDLRTNNSPSHTRLPPELFP
jgi:hypothetical protein